MLPIKSLAQFNSLALFTSLARFKSLTPVALLALALPVPFLVGLVSLAGSSPAASASTPVASGASSSNRADTWEIDPVHSSVIFRAKHMNVSYAYGRFNAISGTIEFNEQDPADCTVALSIQADSVDTANDDRDKHLRSPDFLNAKQFPAITFESTKVEGDGSDALKVMGDLSFLGVTKSVSVRMEKTGRGPGFPAGELIGFEGRLSIQRTDFGCKYGLEGVADQIDLTISIEASKQ